MTVIIGVSLLVADVATAQTAPSEPDTVGLAEDEDSWITQTFNRYFSSNPASDGELDGRAIDLVDRYAEFEGRPIAVVIIHQVERFSSGTEESAVGDGGSLGSLVKKFQTHTRQNTIRQYLLFETGQLIDPFLLADSERMLRGLDFIDDVRIVLFPLSGEDESVAIIVETRDRFPLGATFKLIDVGRYEAGLYSSNVAGLGLRLDNRLIYRDDREPNLGYAGVIGIKSMGGTFIAGVAVFEDSYRRLQKGARITRELVHPAIQWVGGAGYIRTSERDSGPEPDDAEVSDVWAGFVVPLRERSASVTTARPLLIPAISFTRKTYLDRPAVSRDTLSRFHNSQNYLVGLTFQRFKNYKTNYLFEMGETENIPSGTIVKFSPGYQDGEFNDRGMGFFQSGYYGARNRGDVIIGQFDIGGFFRSGHYEDGSLLVRSAYFSPLLGEDSWKSRFYVAFSYALAINRVSDTVLRLGNATGLRGMEDNLVKGNQRIVANFEYRLFTPWQMLGFRFMLLGFADIGTVTGADDPVFEQRIYTSLGLAVRVQNPNLVLPATQLRVAFLNGIEDKGIVFGFELGGLNSDLVRVPGTRPGGFTFR
ncbi:MAG: hypothetical protein ACI9UK_001297 [Candidatus Krumholzibacteriia bacterium]|jgi:hypothetical protein